MRLQAVLTYFKELFARARGLSSPMEQLAMHQESMAWAVAYYTRFDLSFIWDTAARAC
jgi:hypothetical protein